MRKLGLFIAVAATVAVAPSAWAVSDGGDTATTEGRMRRATILPTVVRSGDYSVTYSGRAVELPYWDLTPTRPNTDAFYHSCEAVTSQLAPNTEIYTWCWLRPVGTDDWMAYFTLVDQKPPLAHAHYTTSVPKGEYDFCMEATVYYQGHGRSGPVICRRLQPSGRTPAEVAAQ